MVIVYMMEWDNPKEEERHSKYMKLAGEKGLPYFESMHEKGLCKFSAWVDDTGHVIQWTEFEDMDAFYKLWTSEEWRSLRGPMRRLVNNLQYRLLRKARA